MDDSKEISQQKYDEIKNKCILGIRGLKRPLKLPKLASQLLDFLGLNHRGVLCYLEGGEQVVIHRLQHNVTLTHITELNTSWEEEAGYDFCDTITLRQLWELADVHEMYSYIWKNCIHTSNKILNWGAERGCCKDNKFNEFKRTKGVEDKHTKHHSLYTRSPFEKREDIISAAEEETILTTLARNCIHSVFCTFMEDQWTVFPEMSYGHKIGGTESQQNLQQENGLIRYIWDCVAKNLTEIAELASSENSLLPLAYNQSNSLVKVGFDPLTANNGTTTYTNATCLAP